MTLPLGRWIIISLSLILTACTDLTDQGEPSLIPIDSIALQESDSVFLVEPYDLIVAPDDNLLISDGYAGRILVYARDGSLLRTIGSKGSGPGEFGAPTRMAFAGDSLLYVVDGMVIKKLEMPSGGFTESITLPGIPGSLAIAGSRIFIGQADAQRRTSFVYSDDGGATFASAGFLPEVLASPVVGPAFGWISLATGGERVATAYAVSNNVAITDMATGVSDTIGVPVVKRWGSDSGVFAELAASPTQELVDAAMRSSMPAALSWLPSGLLAVVHSDATLDDTRFVGGHWLSLLNAEAGTVCAEVAVPGPADPRPIVGFRGDTLLVLSQPVERTSASVMVHRFLIDSDTCPGFE